MDVTVSEFQKSATEKVIAKLREFSGRRYADIRVYYLANISDNTYAPTKKGVTIAPDLLPELAEMVNKLMVASEETAHAVDEEAT
jgi:hypothetical protein